MTAAHAGLVGEVTLEGRITAASNATYLGRVDGVAVVYKPVGGERPLWDFPEGTLAQRELAAYLVSEASGWDVVPLTVVRDGPLGVGMVQLWREPDPDQQPVDVVASADVPTQGWRSVLEGSDERGRSVTVIHEDTGPLRRMAVFDVLVNNADRKAGHILPRPGGHRYGVDHGVTFHDEPKLRTVLWGWAGERLDAAELAGVERVREALVGELGDRLSALVSEDERAALAARCERLTADGRFPWPEPGLPAVPWPLF